MWAAIYELGIKGATFIYYRSKLKRRKVAFATSSGDIGNKLPCYGQISAYRASSFVARVIDIIIASEQPE